jgi:hypothetical protein
MSDKDLDGSGGDDLQQPEGGCARVCGDWPTAALVGTRSAVEARYAFMLIAIGVLCGGRARPERGRRIDAVERQAAFQPTLRRS